MHIVFTLIGSILTILALILLAIIVLKKPTLMNQEGASPFECGFDPLSHPRIPFSIQFFLIAILFLIFDVEISLLLPIPLSSPSDSTPLWVFSLFIMILFFGLIHEWNMGSLEWTK